MIRFGVFLEWPPYGPRVSAQTYSDLTVVRVCPLPGVVVQWTRGR